MAKTKPIRFELINIDTPQFAVFDELFKEGCDTKFDHKFSIGADDEFKIINVGFGAKFLCENQVFITIELSCTFQIDKNQFDQLFYENDKIRLPKDFITHLMMLTIGITRGVLYEKLKSTSLSNLYLPSINLKELINEDAILEKG